MKFTILRVFMSINFFQKLQEPDPKISDSITLIIKLITHRGTQTIIQCNPDMKKDDFVDTIVKTKV